MIDSDNYSLDGVNGRRTPSRSKWEDALGSHTNAHADKFGLQVDAQLVTFIETEALRGAGIGPMALSE